MSRTRQGASRGVPSPFEFCRPTRNLPRSAPPAPGIIFFPAFPRFFTQLPLIYYYHFTRHSHARRRCEMAPENPGSEDANPANFSHAPAILVRRRFYSSRLTLRASAAPRDAIRVSSRHRRPNEGKVSRIDVSIVV